jgi:hypothetical protein
MEGPDRVCTISSPKAGRFGGQRSGSEIGNVSHYELTGDYRNVQVTLEILKALIEKCPRDLPLYVGAVLRMLRTILKSNDLSMLEESVPTFEALCAHQDPANLAADQDYIRSYEEIVQLYAFFASKESVKSIKQASTWSVAIKYRKAGLRALKAVASSESLGSETGRQLNVVVPSILWNIYAQDGDYLKILEGREHKKDEHDKEQAFRRRQSISTVRTVEDEEGDPIAASGTTEDADKLAEEEVGVIALQALRNIFIGVNRGQLRLATSAVLKFIGTHVRPQQHLETPASSWPVTLMVMICSWSPVQDRYAILVGAMENLIRSPIVEDDLERQLVLATVIDCLLKSPINFIGLSVMDVLVGLISHTLLLLQLGGQGSTIVPHHQQTTSATSEDLSDSKTSGNAEGVVMEVVKEPSEYRMQLLNILQKCMASLATHVYYSDQISDMVKAIMSRLKPSSLSGVSSADAIEDPTSAINAVASTASLNEKQPQVDRFFSFETARILALEAVKAIITTANTRRPDGSSASVSRGPVGVSVWEGTQWLLRDPSGQVRKAYVDALVTWLNLEKKKDDLKIVDDYRKKEKESKHGDLARRAVSNASHREKSPKPWKNTFLALLHLAVYENALQYTDSEPDLLLLHLLLTTLVNKLGVNAVRTGLPMIWRLQEDIQSIENPSSKIRVGSLVHGYLWALSMALDFETSSVGRAVHSEISRRNQKGLWVKNIRVPPIPIDRIETPHADQVRLSSEVVANEALKPFDDRGALVDKISDGYTTSLTSPPSSPPGSPGRSLSVSLLQPQILKPLAPLPYKVKEELLSEWNRDICIATHTKDPSSASMTGSRTGASASQHHTQKNNYLGVQIPNGGLDSINNSPLPSPRRAHSRPPSTAYGLVGRVASPHRNESPSRTPGSTSSRHSAVRVDDLKRVLSGAAPRTSYSIRPQSFRQRDDERNSSASESMVSVHSLSDASFVTAGDSHHPHENPSPKINADSPESPPIPSASLTPRPNTSHTTTSPVSPSSPGTNASQAYDHAYSGSGVPPVPPIPASLRSSSTSPHGQSKEFSRPKTAPTNGNGSINVRKSRSIKRSSMRTSGRSGSGSRTRSNENGNGGVGVARKGTIAKKPDFANFLNSIDAEEDEDDVPSLRRVPY